MPAAFDRCVKQGGRVRTKKLSKGRILPICFDKQGKSHPGEVKMGKKENITWSSPIQVITEDIKEGGHDKPRDRARIKGTAIKASVSRNGVLYEFSELEKAKETLVGTTIAMGHSEAPEDSVGKIEEVIMTNDGIDYTGTAFNTAKFPDTVGLLEKGLIKHVSIEAIIPSTEPNKEGHRVAKDIEFMGMGFVRHPGIPDASANLAEALEKREKDYIDANEAQIKEEGEDMKDGLKETKEEQPQPSEEQNDTKTSQEKALQETQKFTETLKSEVEALKKEITETKEQMKEMKTEESKGVVTETTEPSEGFIYENKVTDDLKRVQAENLGKEDKVFLYKKAQRESVFFPLDPSQHY